MMNTLIFTAPAGEALEPGIKTSEPDDGSGLSVIIGQHGYTDHLLISDQGSQTMRAAKLDGMGEILWVRTDASGKAVAAGAVAGSKLSWNGRVLLRSREPGYLSWSK